MRTHNNTDGNKLVIFSGIALYYDDTYIVSRYLIGNMCTCFYSQMFSLLVNAASSSRVMVTLDRSILLRLRSNCNPAKKYGNKT